MLLLLSMVLTMPWSAAYNDHRGHNLDSLERVVARWTPDAIDKASEQELIQLNRDYRDLMLGYAVMNGDNPRVVCGRFRRLPLHRPNLLRPGAI